jgi:SAM-dependent methyltransferase
MDNRQDVFEDFEVPDPIRIDKAIRFIRERFSSIKDLNILECGMAKGGVADRLSKEGANCQGIDINPRHLEGVPVIQRDLNDGYPALDKKFDVIFAGEVMEHLYDDTKFVRDSMALLAPGGILVLTVPHLFFSVNRLRMFFGMMPLFAYASYHYHFYGIKVLRELLEGQGLKISGLVSSHVLFSKRRNSIGRIFEILGDIMPSMGAHLIVCAERPDALPSKQ